MRAEAAGDPGPWRQQAILGRGRWDADALRDVVREYAMETLADPDAVLVIDETGFLKQGKSSCGGGRQYTGSAGSPKRGAFAAGITPRRRRVRVLCHVVPGAGTGIDTLVAVEGQCWAIEDSLETAKTELGLDHNESRSWVVSQFEIEQGIARKHPFDIARNIISDISN